MGKTPATSKSSADKKTKSGKVSKALTRYNRFCRKLKKQLEGEGFVGNFRNKYSSEWKKSPRNPKSVNYDEKLATDSESETEE